jgi:hypothetical protein
VRRRFDVFGAPLRARDAIAFWTLWSTALLWLPTGARAAAPEPAPRLAVEEVLRQAARITWSDGSPRVVQRRARGADAWVDVGRGTGSLIDPGPLAPGDYTYRAGADSAELTMPPQCAGGADPPGNEALGALPIVEIGDLDGDRRYTGADVWLALQRCSALGGCVLEALPVTYDDVAISLYGQNDRRPCTIWNPLVCEPMPAFPNGLVIEGHGSATVFRSPIWKSPYKPAPIFEIWHAPGVQVRLRNFTLDGRKGEQPDPTPGRNDSDSEWQHDGIFITHNFGPDHTQRYPNGCVHNVTARNLFHAGINVNHTRNWRIEYNRVHDIGCWKGITECPQLHLPDNMPPPGWGCAGFSVVGYGIYLDAWSDDTEVAHNEVERVTKYALGLKGGAGGTDPITRLSVHDNRIANVGVLGIYVGGAIDSVVEHNLVDGTHAYGCRDGWAWNFWGIHTGGSLRNTRVRENTLRNLAGVGIGSNASADRLVFADNRIENACVERNARVGSRQAAIEIGAETSGRFTLSHNSVTQNHCSMSIAVGWRSSAEVVVDGGYYSTAENSELEHGAVTVASDDTHMAPRMILKGGAVFEYVGGQQSPGLVARIFDALGGEAGHGIAAVASGRVVVQDDSVVVKGYREPFVELRSCVDGCTAQKSGVIVRCTPHSSDPECR